MAWHLMWVFFRGGGTTVFGGGSDYSVSGSEVLTDANGCYSNIGNFNGRKLYRRLGLESDWYLYWATDPIMEYSGWVISTDTYYSETLWYWYSDWQGFEPPQTMEGYIGGGIGTLTLIGANCS